MASHSEAERHIGDLADHFGWLHHHSRSPGLTRRGHPDGFPSEALIRGKRLVFMFVTTASLSPQQAEWLDALRDVASIEAHVCLTHELPTVTQLLRPVGV